MKTLLLFLSFLMTNLLFAQQKNTIWTRYYDYNWTPSKPPNVQYYTVVDKTDSGYGRLDYYVRERKVKMEGYYEDDSCKIPNGRFTYFYPSGKPQMQGWYAHGKKEGLWVEVYESGKWKDSTVYKNDNPIGTSLGFYENGNMKDSSIVDELGVETYIRWFENGNVDCAGRYVLGNVPIQTWLYYHSNGQLASREKYDKGALVNKEYFDENGNVMDTANRDREAEFPGGTKAWK